MKVLLMAAAVGFGLAAFAGTASADPWKGGHGRFGGKHWKHDGHPGRGHAYGHRRFPSGYDRPRGYSYYGEGRGYRGARFSDFYD